MAMDRLESAQVAAVPDGDGDVAETLHELIEVLVDGQLGYEHAADKLDDSEYAATFRALGAERAELVSQLANVAARYDVEVDEDGSLEAAMHRAWISLKSALTAGDDHAIIAAAEEGEDHAVEKFSTALASALPADVDAAVRRVYGRVKEAHDRLSALQDLTE